MTLKAYNEEGALMVDPDTDDLEKTVKVSGLGTQQDLKAVIVQLKILNMHMSLITNTDYKEGDV